MTYTIAALYRFVPLADTTALRDELRSTFPETSGLCGTLILAPEGINGTLAGSSETIDRLLDFLAERTGLDRSEVKFSASGERPFGRLKFLCKQEIIPFRKAPVDLTAETTQTGTYVAPEDWNNLLTDPGVLVLDTRNHYETALGTFTGAIDPHIDTFSDFATWVRDHLDPAQTPRVAMFCTGGIRCEKASAFMLQQGFREVYHLRGGILKYLEDVPPQTSRWQGDCFVFDRRTSVSHSDFQGNMDTAAAKVASDR